MLRAKRSSSRHSNRSAQLLSRRGRRRAVSSFAQRERLHCACTKPREAGASSLGVHGRESPASRSLLSCGSGGGWQRQWCAWSAAALSRELLCSFRHGSGRAQHRSGLPRTRGLTLLSKGRAQAGFAAGLVSKMFGVPSPKCGRATAHAVSCRLAQTSGRRTDSVEGIR
jgi:hypothetical protein